MRSTTFTLLAAALASVCSAAPTASALPAKFTLSYTTLDHTSELPSTSTIVSDPGYGFTLILNQSKDNSLTVTELTSGSTTAFVPHPIFTRNADWFIGMRTPATDGHVGLLLPVDIAAGGLRTTGLGRSSAGSLTWDLYDGAGPQSLWMGCEVRGEFVLSWDAKGASCHKIELKIHAL